MDYLAAALAIFGVGGVLCLLTIGRPAWSRRLGPAITVLGAGFGLYPAVLALLGTKLAPIALPWSMPFGSFTLELDALSALFAIPILLISALAAIYGSGYLRHYEGKKELAPVWFLYNLLIGSMLLVVTARNGMLFLAAWEVMSLSSFFLVLFEHEEEASRRAGWTYFVATHIGTAFLLVMFLLLGSGQVNLDFANFSVGSGLASAIFLLAVIGFGTKAGFMPLHVWLPEAHPAAPSHVSAVMSGVMIKTGIYGLVRILCYLGTPPAWWGWVLVTIGLVSGILGVAFALAQHDLKRLLAYHSVENIGIIALGLGLGMLGVSYDIPLLAFLGFAGGLLHVMNHAIFKSLLFLTAGAVAHRTGTRDIEHLGGLLKRMPMTGLFFLVGSVAICGLPPLNGFLSEFLIYFGSIHTIAQAGLGLGPVIGALLVMAALALIGGLAVACFTKAFGIVFLGEPRSPHAEHAREVGPAMYLPMTILALLCAVIGLSGPFLLPLLQPAVSVLTGDAASAIDLAPAGHSLLLITLIAFSVLVLAGLLALLRSRLLAGRKVAAAVTWDCGYTAPTARMQYSASSFADPLTRLFGAVLRTHHRFVPPQGLFPRESSFSSETPDLYRERVYGPAFAYAENFLGRFRWLQHGRLNFYILFIVIALLALMAWKLS